MLYTRGQCVKNKIPARHGGTCCQALRTQRQEDLCEFKARLVYLGSSRTAKTIQRDPVSLKQNKTKLKKKREKKVEILKCGGTLKCLAKMKEARHKEPHTVLFHFCEVSRREKEDRLTVCLGLDKEN